MNGGPSGLVIVIAPTSRQRDLPSHVEIDIDAGLDMISYAKCEDVKSISTEHLVHFVGVVGEPEIERIPMNHAPPLHLTRSDVPRVLAQHLASWGIVTASTDHPSRGLLDVIGGTAEGQRPAIDDSRSLRTYLTTLDADPLLGGALDNDRVALGGHSAGGATVAEMAGDEGILGYVSYASGLGDEAPDIPSLFMAGELDMIVDPVERTALAFERAPAPSWLWSFADSGHLAFSDLCAVGSEGATLIDLAEAAGLGDLVDDRLRTLGTDGCEPPNRPVEEVWPGVHQAATEFYRWVFGTDAEPIGLDASAVTDGVTVTAK